MTRRRAQMISIVTGEPIDPQWQPLLALEELEPANALMAKNQLDYIWRWIPQTIALDGTATLLISA